jgi:hypothetical protein
VSISGDVAADFNGFPAGDKGDDQRRSENPDPSFMRGVMWSLVLSLTLWAAAVFLAFSVFG